MAKEFGSDSVLLAEQATVPGGAPAAGEGKLYVKNTVPTTLVFVDDVAGETLVKGGDFVDGGEAGGADRTLGNTDAFALGLTTNNLERVHIGSDGFVGINQASPTRYLEVVGNTFDEAVLISNADDATGDPATGSLTVIAHAAYASGSADNFILSDGTNPAITFRYVHTGTGPGETSTLLNVDAGDTKVGYSATQMAVVTRDRINAVGGSLNITASTSGTAVVTLTNDAVGAAGNVAIIENVSNAGFTASGMSGGNSNVVTPTALSVATGNLIVGTGKVGVGTSTPQANLNIISEERINASASPADANKYYYHKVVVSTIVTSWTTIKTLTPSNTSGYTEGMVEFHVMAVTSSVAASSVFSRWRITLLGGPPTVAVLGGNVNTTGFPAGVRLLVSGNDILMQIQSSNGTNSMYATVTLDIYCPGGQGSTTDWTLT